MGVVGAVLRTIAVVRHELRIALHSPMSYVLAMAMLLALAICLFVVADFLSTDAASVRLLGVFAPWLAIVFVPALVMRAWINEGTDRTLEFVLSLPLGSGALVCGKFFAAAVFLALVGVGTLAFPITVAWLGAPDGGAVLGTYLGVAMALLCFVCVALLAAACVHDSTSAFIAGTGALFVLVLLGHEASGRALGRWLPPSLVDAITLAGPGTWIDDLSSGRIDAAACVYFGLLGALSLAGAASIVSLRRHAAPAGRITLRGAALLVAGVCVATFAASGVQRQHWSLDLSEAREHTLSDASRAMLGSLPGNVAATLYWSASTADIPAPIRHHARRVRAMLNAIALDSAGQFSLTEVQPSPDSEAELQALGVGLRRVPLSSGDAFFLGATLRYADRVLPIPYLDIERAALLEYELVSTLNSLLRARTPRVGIVSPLVAPSALRDGRQGLSLLGELSARYDVAVVPYFADALPADLDVVIAIDAALLKRSMLESIDRFVVDGGALIALLDPFARFNQAGQQLDAKPSSEVDDISDLLAAWGLEFQSQHVVGDAQLAAPVSIEGGGATGYPFWIRADERALSRSHPATAMLNEVLLVEPGEFVLGEQAEALITTTDTSGTLERGAFAGASAQSVLAKFAPGTAKRVLAAWLRGPLHSALDGRAGVAPARVFAVADVDFIFDPFAVEVIDTGGRALTRPVNDNHAFLLALVATAIGEATLAEVRMRATVRRPFTRIEALFRAGENDVREELAELASSLAQGERHIGALLAASGAGSVDELHGEVATTVQALTVELLPIRQRQRELRAEIRAGVDRLRAIVTAVNFAFPIVIVLAGAWLARRMRRHF